MIRQRTIHHIHFVEDVHRNIVVEQCIEVHYIEHFLVEVVEVPHKCWVFPLQSEVVWWVEEVWWTPWVVEEERLVSTF